MADGPIKKKFRKSPDFDKDRLIRDLEELIDQLNAEIVKLQDRLTLGGL